MGEEPQPAAQLAAHDLGPALEPALIEACEGRLTDVHWFRVDWQRSGAATAYAKYDVGGEPRDVVVKLPIGPREYHFATALSGRAPQFASIVAHGMEVGGYDLAWIVMERVPGDPLAARLHKSVFMGLAEAAAAFYQHAREAFPDVGDPRDEDWEGEIGAARKAVKDNHIPREQEWSNALKETQKALPRLLARWKSRPADIWCHGDLHPGNLMQRNEGSAWGEPSCVLLDMAEVHAGHWVEDAVYVERRYWGKPDVLEGIKPVSLIAKAMKKNGVTPDDSYADLANIRRVLMAATAPAFLRSEGHPAHLAGALATLEKTLPLCK